MSVVSRSTGISEVHVLARAPNNDALTGILHLPLALNVAHLIILRSRS
jgi:hypothetical protein